MEYDLSPASVWITQRFKELEDSLSRHNEIYDVAHSIQSLQIFIWDELADWYIEYLKTDETQKSFARDLFKQVVVTISPYMPFEAEVLWKEFFHESQPLAFYVKDQAWTDEVLRKTPNVESVHEFETIREFIINIRSLRGLFAIDPGIKLRVFSASHLLQDYKEFIYLLAKTEVIQQARAELYTVTTEAYTYHIDIHAYIDNPKHEIQRTLSHISSLIKQIESLNKQLSNSSFLENAGSEVIEDKEFQLSLRTQELKQQEEKIKFLEKVQ